MMTLNKIPFKEVNGAGLFVDTVYEGGSDKNISSEVISKLLHVGNSGGFRKCMKVEGGKKTKAAAYVCIYSIDSVEWRNQQYDTIFCTNVLSAVPYYIERLQILKNAKSVLKDSGVLFISTQYRNSYFNTYNERADIQRFIDGWLIPRTNKKYCFYAPITENALSELCVDAGLQIKKVFKHDGSCFIIAAKPVDGVQW